MDRLLTRSGPRLFIGVDGGGSRCRVRIRDALGRLVGEAEGGAANVYLDFDAAIATIRGAITAAFRNTGLEHDVVSASSAGLGLAGASSREVADRVAAALPTFAMVRVEHDGVAACLGAHAGQDGGLVIAGTGSVAVLRRGSDSISIGGRGFLLGDDGSGAWIGRAIWRRALRAYDGLEPTSPLLAALLSEFGDDPVRVIGWGRAAPSHAYAAYAPRVFGAAANGDPAATAVAQQAGHAIGELIAVLQQREAPRISLVGGMAEAIGPYLPASARGALAPPLADALEGALFLAGLPTVSHRRELPRSDAR